MFRILLTGASGTMGQECLRYLAGSNHNIEVHLVLRPSSKNRKLIGSYQGCPGLKVWWGDMTDYGLIYRAIEDIDMVIHAGALVSPEADSQPKKTMAINYGSTLNFLRAIDARDYNAKVRFVYISSVAVMGDRMPPFHWGRVGDPVMPSIFDYYALSKAASERAVIESKLKDWVVLRMSGILGAKMAQIQEPIIFHNPLNNVLEYVTLPDVGQMIANLVFKSASRTLDEGFYRHIYNVGGGATCQIATWQLYEKIYGDILGFRDLDKIIEPQLYATRNFHGHFYLDSARLDRFLDFQHHGMEYFYEEFKKTLGMKCLFIRFINRLPILRDLLAWWLRESFRKIARKPKGPLNRDFISSPGYNVYYGAAVSPGYSRFPFWRNYSPTRHFHYGLDLERDESDLTLEDIKNVASLRGGRCLSDSMVPGDWDSPKEFVCAKGHVFWASPRLIIEGGHWCGECGKTHWEYGALIEGNPFLRQFYHGDTNSFTKNVIPDDVHKGLLKDKM
ncbi:MAG: NAD(P)-dependent oxidoreductase [Erysipelotrichaceae bacterium]|nr:NAD(P)-dependent oxidoreductase [Erysipelotrichaceae bacterium]